MSFNVCALIYDAFHNDESQNLTHLIYFRLS